MTTVTQSSLGATLPSPLPNLSRAQGNGNSPPAPPHTGVLFFSWNLLGPGDLTFACSHTPSSASMTQYV